jgi:hypothetical protein
LRNDDYLGRIGGVLGAYADHRGLHDLGFETASTTKILALGELTLANAPALLSPRYLDAKRVPIAVVTPIRHAKRGANSRMTLWL